MGTGVPFLLSGSSYMLALSIHYKPQELVLSLNGSLNCIEQGHRVSDFPFLELEAPGVSLRNLVAPPASKGKLA